jgi:voltage-gated potassium channel
VVSDSRREYGETYGHVVASVADLSSIPLFESLGPSDLQELAGWFDLQEAGQGQRLTAEGAAGYAFYVLLEGTAVVDADGATLGQLGPGDFFGEMAILGDGRRTATVTTTSSAKLLFMFGTEFRRLQQALPDVAARIEETVRQRVEANAAAMGSPSHSGSPNAS